MAQPLPPEPSPPPEAPAPDRTPGPAQLGLDQLDLEADRHLRLLREPPERKVTGPRVRPALRKRPVPAEDVPMPARGLGMTIVSYLIAGIVAYGGIGWLIGRAVHVPALAPAGMALGLVISISLIIYRYGRSTPPRIRRFAPKPVPKPAATEPDEQNGPMTTQLQYNDSNDARGTDR